MMGLYGLRGTAIRARGRKQLPVTGTPSQVAGVFLDNFDRADQALDTSANWTAYAGSSGAFSVVSGKLDITGSGKAIGSLTVAPDTGSADHFAEVQVGAVVNVASIAALPAIRINPDGSYLGFRQTASSFDIIQYIASTNTASRLTSSGPAPAVGDIVRIYAVGSTVFLAVNGTMVSSAQTAVTSGTLAGMALRTANNLATRYDLWRSGSGVG